MKWFPKNPEVTRPIAVCALLVGGAVIAELGDLVLVASHRIERLAV